MATIGDSPNLNLRAFEQLTRSKGADDSQVRVSDDGSVKARSAFATRVVNLFRSNNAIEASNREVAEAFVATVQKSLDRQVKASEGGLSQQWSADIVETLRSQLAEQLSGKASLSLRDLKDRLTYLRDDIGVGKFVHKADVKTQALQSLIEQFSASTETQPSLADLTERFQAGQSLQADEVGRVKTWLTQAQGVSDEIEALIDGAEVDGLSARIESKVLGQRAAGETDSAEAWQETLTQIKDWQIFAGEATTLHKATVDAAKHLVRCGGDFSKSVEGQKGHRWTDENRGHEPLAGDAQPKKSLLKRSAAAELDPTYQWWDKGGEKLPSNAPVDPADVQAKPDRYAPSAEGRIVGAIIRDKALPGEGHEATRLDFAKAALDPAPAAVRPPE
jgi:hypothetical protein